MLASAKRDRHCHIEPVSYNNITNGEKAMITGQQKRAQGASRAPAPTAILRGARPRRGLPSETRERLVASAAELFNTVGYHGTDSNRIARNAGYTPGVFYKHFKDKCEIFLAVYEGWIAAEWKAIEAELARGHRSSEKSSRDVRPGPPAVRPHRSGAASTAVSLSAGDRTARTNSKEVARRLVLLTVDFHRRWRGFRSSLLGLLQENPAVKRFYLNQRRRQLDLVAKLRSRVGGRKHKREEDAVHLFTMERCSDAIAQGHVRLLGLDEKAVIDFLTDQVMQALS